MKRTVAISKWAKYALASASSIVLLATAFTSSALAEVRDGFDSLASYPLNQLAQTEDESIQGSTQDNADTVTTWDSATKTLTLNKDATKDELRKDITNHVTEMETFDFGEGHTLTITSSMAGTPLFVESEAQMTNTKLTSIKGTFHFSKGTDSQYSIRLLAFFFYGCVTLKDVSALGDWKFPQEYLNDYGFCLNQTFAFCESVDNWDFLKNWMSQEDGIAVMSDTFVACSSMKIFDALKDADTSYCNNVVAAFANCTSLEVLDISNWTSTNWHEGEEMYGMFAVVNLTTGAIEGSLPNLYQITMGNDCLPTIDSYFPYSDGWNAYYNGEIQATISSKDELAAYQASAKAKGWGPTTYVKVGHDPYVPTPDPDPTPEPTPEPTPASDGTLIPSTGDTTSMAAVALTLSAVVLLGVAALGLTLSKRLAKYRQ